MKPPPAACRSRPLSRRVLSGCCSDFELSRNPFQTDPTYRVNRQLPLADQLTHLHRPECARRHPERDQPRPMIRFPPAELRQYVPGRKSAGLPAAAGKCARPPRPAVRAGNRNTRLSGDADGRGPRACSMCRSPNSADGNLDAVHETLRAPSAVPGLSDGGAHCGIICDASFPTYLFTTGRPTPVAAKTLHSVRGGGAVAQDRALGRPLRPRRDRTGF